MVSLFSALGSRVSPSWIARALASVPFVLVVLYMLHELSALVERVSL